MSISPAASATTLARRVKVTAVSPEIISIRVDAPQAAEAVADANAVTRTYIHYAESEQSLGDHTLVVLRPAVASTLRFPVRRVAIDGFAGLMAGLTIGTLAWRKQRRDWRDVQLV
jgi:hypothetical protein